MNRAEEQRPGPPARENSLIIVRTHRADDAALEAFDRFKALDRTAVVFCVDERAGPVDMQGRDKVAYDGGILAGMGLYAHPQCGWRCGDYCYYVVRQYRPGFSHYWLIEPDVRFNTADLDGFFDKLNAIAADYIAPKFGPRGAHWSWTSLIAAAGFAAHGGVFPVTRLSGAAIDHAYAIRRNLSLDPAIATPDAWPNDESFVASVLASRGFACVDINHDGIQRISNTSFRSGPVVDYSLTKARPPDELIYHPVRDFDAYLDNCESHLGALAFVPAVTDTAPSPPALLHAITMLGVSVADHPIHGDAALIPLLLKRHLLTRQLSLVPEQTPADQMLSYRHQLNVCNADLARWFGPTPERRQIATAHVILGRRDLPQRAPVRADDLVLGEGLPLGLVPIQYSLPYAVDLETDEILLTTQLRPCRSLRAFDPGFCQRKTTNIAIRVPAPSLPHVFAGHIAAHPPVLAFHLGGAVPPLLHHLLAGLTPRLAAEPGVIAQLAAARAHLDEMPEDKRISLIQHAILPFMIAHGPPPSATIVTLPGQALLLSDLLAAAFPVARIFILVPSRSGIVSASFARERLSPEGAAARIIARVTAAQAFESCGHEVTPIPEAAWIADPIGVSCLLAGVEPDAKLRDKLDVTMRRVAAFEKDREAATILADRNKLDDWTKMFEQRLKTLSAPGLFARMAFAMRDRGAPASSE